MLFPSPRKGFGSAAAASFVVDIVSFVTVHAAVFCFGCRCCYFVVVIVYVAAADVSAVVVNLAWNSYTAQTY